MAQGGIRKSQSNSQFPWMRGIKIALLILLFFVCVFSVSRMKDTNQFPIQTVKIYGVKYLNQNEMQSFLVPLVSKGFFMIDVDLIKERLLQMPWVSDVWVRRIWPNQIVLAVAERNPVAYWNETSVLSSTGEIFTPAINTVPSDLPHFVGPEGEQIHMLEVYTKIEHLLHPLHLKITQLELTPYLSWNVAFAGGMKVRLGYKDVLTRIHHFVKVYRKVVGERAADVDYIDLRYPNGLAIRWKTVS